MKRLVVAVLCLTGCNLFPPTYPPQPNDGGSSVPLAATVACSDVLDSSIISHVSAGPGASNVTVRSWEMFDRPVELVVAHDGGLLSSTPQSCHMGCIGGAAASDGRGTTLVFGTQGNGSLHQRVTVMNGGSSQSFGDLPDALDAGGQRAAAYDPVRDEFSLFWPGPNQLMHQRRRPDGAVIATGALAAAGSPLVTSAAWSPRAYFISGGGFLRAFSHDGGFIAETSAPDAESGVVASPDDVGAVVDSKTAGSRIDLLQFNVRTGAIHRTPLGHTVGAQPVWDDANGLWRVVYELPSRQLGVASVTTSGALAKTDVCGLPGAFRATGAVLVGGSLYVGEKSVRGTPGFHLVRIDL